MAQIISDDPVQALMAQLMGAGASTAALPVSAPTTQPGVQTPVDNISEIERLLQVVQPEALTRKQKVLGGLADAVNAFLTTKYGGPRPPSVIEGYRQRNEQDAERKTKEGMSRARILEGRRQEGREDTRETRQEGREDTRYSEETKRRAQEGEAERAAEAQTARDRVAAESDLLTRRQVFDAEESRLDRQSRERLSKDESDTTDRVLTRQMSGEQREALKQAKVAIVGLKGQIPTLLAGSDEKPPMTPEQIMESAMDDIDAMGLDQEGKETAEAFLELKIGPMLREQEQKTAQKRPLTPQQVVAQSRQGEALNIPTSPVGLMELLRGVELF